MSTKCTLRPVGDKLIVKLEETQSDSPIVLVNENEDKRLGTVLRVGPGAEGQESGSMGISEGERVWFGKFSGTELHDDYFVLRAEDVLAVEEA